MKKKDKVKNVNTEQTYVDPAVLRQKKQWRNRIISAVLVVFLAAGAAGLKYMSTQAEKRQDLSSSSVQKETVSATVGTADITDTLQGYGTVASANQSSYEVPGNITVTHYYVEAGDSVSKGDPIAALDRSSVLAAIADNEALVASLDERLDEILEESKESKITATVDGTVVKIYAGEDKSVVDTMYADGALMLISLDGLLAIDIPNTTNAQGGNYGVGDALTVTNAEGEEFEGIVSDVTKDSITVTVSLEDFDYGEEVTVSGDAGEIKKDTLYIYSQQKITGYSGTVSSISVEEGDEIDKDDKLMTLTDIDFTGDYQYLLTQRNKLVEQYNTLVSLAETGILYADSDGMITELNTNILDEEDGTEGKVKNVSMNTDENEGGFIGTSTRSLTGGMQNTSAISGPTTTASPVRTTCIAAVRTAATPAPTTEDGSEGGENPSEGGTAGNGAEGDTTGSGSAGSDAAEGSPTEGETSQGETVTKTVTVEWKDENGNPLETGMPESLEVTLLADGVEIDKVEIPAEDEWSYSWENLPVYNGSLSISYTVCCDVPSGFTGSFKLIGDKMVLIFTKAAQSENPGGTTPGSGQGGNETPGGNSQGGNETPGGNSQGGSEVPGGNGQGGSDIPSGGDMPSGSGQGGNSQMPSDFSGGSFSGGSMPSGSGSFSGSSSSFSAYFGTSGTTSGVDVSSMSGMITGTQKTDSFVQGVTTLGTIVPNDEVCVDVVIDELDIRKVVVGTEVSVTLDAISGETFTGVITAIDENGSNSGGNTKYTVTVTMDKTDKMLIGMNASVIITGDTESGVLTVPSAALVSKDGKSYVYTSWDEKDDILGDLVEVTTGMASTDLVEIREGLTEGDTVYYKYTDTISYTFIQGRNQ